MVVTKASEKELSHAIQESFVDLFSSLCTASPNATLRREDDMIIYSSGYPNSLLNGVLAPMLTSESMAGRVEHALSFFAERGLPMTFFVNPSSTPENLDEHLLERGLKQGWARPGMAIDLDTVRALASPDRVEIYEVDDETSLRMCADTFARGFFVGEDAIGWARNLVLGYGFDAERRWLVGFLDGRPVSTSLLVTHNGIAGIYCVATLPELRGRGIETALTLKSLLLAKDMGHEYAVLQSSMMGLPVYEKLGFKEYCRIRAYIWHPG